MARQQYTAPVPRHSGVSRGGAASSVGKASMKSLRFLELERADQEREAIKLAVNLFNGGGNMLLGQLESTSNNGNTKNKQQDKSVNDVLLFNSVMESGYKSGYKSNNNKDAPDVKSQQAQNNNMMLFGPTGDNLDSDQLSEENAPVFDEEYSNDPSFETSGDLNPIESANTSQRSGTIIKTEDLEYDTKPFTGSLAPP